MVADSTFIADCLELLEFGTRDVQSQDFVYPYLGNDTPEDAAHEHLVEALDACSSCWQPALDAQHQSRLLAIDSEIFWEKGYPSKPGGSSLLLLPKPSQKRLMPRSSFGAVSLVRLRRFHPAHPFRQVSEHSDHLDQCRFPHLRIFFMTVLFEVVQADILPLKQIYRYLVFLAHKLTPIAIHSTRKYSPEILDRIQILGQRWMLYNGHSLLLEKDYRIPSSMARRLSQ
uniref:AlNc14C198G8612 protein n=1 Tax=Albugo laibachii Nc14 TaxID=890382 RepID=F0WQE2_9STRA|nr:AlNc14C198G8612 [Albugo laibachii Nc14]|eukprot:CCA23550.1 AlNc14C198G8612 [Albugo laibachii Nc14]